MKFVSLRLTSSIKIPLQSFGGGAMRSMGEENIAKLLKGDLELTN